MTKYSGDPGSREPVTPSNDTVRIARALATRPAEPPAPSLTLVEAVIEQRALRLSYLPEELLHEPAWDMLLELFHADLSGRSLVEPMLYKAGGVSAASGAKWIDALASKGLCVRSIDASNAARVVVKLSMAGRQAMSAYFAGLGGRADASS